MTTARSVQFRQEIATLRHVVNNAARINPSEKASLDIKLQGLGETYIGQLQDLEYKMADAKRDYKVYMAALERKPESISTAQSILYNSLSTARNSNEQAMIQGALNNIRHYGKEAFNQLGPALNLIDSACIANIQKCQHKLQELEAQFSQIAQHLKNQVNIVGSELSKLQNAAERATAKRQADAKAAEAKRMADIAEKKAFEDTNGTTQARELTHKLLKAACATIEEQHQNTLYDLSHAGAIGSGSPSVAKAITKLYNQLCKNIGNGAAGQAQALATANALNNVCNRRLEELGSSHQNTDHYQAVLNLQLMTSEFNHVKTINQHIKNEKPQHALQEHAEYLVAKSKSNLKHDIEFLETYHKKNSGFLNSKYTHDKANLALTIARTLQNIERHISSYSQEDFAQAKKQLAGFKEKYDILLQTEQNNAWIFKPKGEGPLSNYIQKTLSEIGNRLDEMAGAREEAGMQGPAPSKGGG